MWLLLFVNWIEGLITTSVVILPLALAVSIARVCNIGAVING
jgi:hypothetical protein